MTPAELKPGMVLESESGNAVFVLEEYNHLWKGWKGTELQRRADGRYNIYRDSALIDSGELNYHIITGPRAEEFKKKAKL